MYFLVARKTIFQYQVRAQKFEMCRLHLGNPGVHQASCEEIGQGVRLTMRGRDWRINTTRPCNLTSGLKQ